MAYGDFKDLNRRTFADKALRDKAFNTAKDQNYDGYQRRLSSMDHNFLIKNFWQRYENLSIKELVEELHKPIIRNFNQIKVHSLFIDNICGADLADMQLISKFNKGFRFSFVLLAFRANILGSFL